MDISVYPCDFSEIRGQTAEYLLDNNIIAEGFWEEHVLAARHYKMQCDGQTAGFFAVYGGETLVLFCVFDDFLYAAQPLFERAKHFESVSNAWVATGDELFLSLCADSFSRLEKQAYFAVYPDRLPENTHKIALKRADLTADRDIIKLCGDFWDEELEKHDKNLPHADIFIAEHDNQTVGFGVIEYGRVLTQNASVGMFVLERFRRRGYASDILRSLCGVARENGALRVLSGCWYYNHNSKKSMERAGARIKSRLLRFYF